MPTYEPVIGLEVHAQLLTHSKLLCSCSVEFGAEPNQNICPVCLGLPGSLPVVNEQAVRLGVRAALALGCSIRPRSIFARKHYFYPDLPKGYQISQYEEPFSVDGELEINVDGVSKRARISRIHLEEDAGKNVHGVAGQSLVDLNRAGTPLIEIVGAPDLHSSAEAAAYLRALREVLIFIGVNDGNLEEGSFRCDANVSLRPAGSQTLGTRTELKNLNSFRFVQKAIDMEIERQARILDEGGQVEQETRAFDPDSGQTRTLRSKADAHDYRYFPEPDLPPLVLPEVLVDAERRALPELPAALRQRWSSELGLSPNAVATLSQHPKYVELFEAVLAKYPEPVKAANWILTEVLRDTKTRGLAVEFPVSAEQIARLLSLLDEGKINGPQAKKIHATIAGTDQSPDEVVSKLGLAIVGDDEALLPICRRVLEENAKTVAQYRAGKTSVIGFFVGQVMKQTRGAADPKRVTELLTKLLSADAERG